MKQWLRKLFRRSEAGKGKRSRDEIDFLPAVLAIQRRPPSPGGRLLAWTIVIMVTVALLWFTNSRVDVVSIAQGKIIPSGRIKTIQPYQMGVVKKLLVAEGDIVKAGEPLIELDAVLTQSNVENLQNQIASAFSAKARYEEFLGLIRGPSDLAATPLPDRVGTLMATLQLALLQAEWRNYRANVQLLEETLQARKAELRGANAEIERLSSTLPFITERARAMKEMVDKRLAARNDYLELEEQRINQTQELLKQRAHIEEIEAIIQKTIRQLRVFKTDAMENTLREIERLSQQALSLQEELEKAQALNKKRVLHSPVDGVVQELAVHTVGGVVTAAQPLMNIVPDETQLVVEAFLANKDIGFVHVGQAGEIKVHAFPFTRYGVIKAEVVRLSDAAVADKQTGWVYKMRLKMAEDRITINGEEVRLRPGMEVTAEIKTGTRYLMSYFLSPILKAADESLRER